MILFWFIILRCAICRHVSFFSRGCEFISAGRADAVLVNTFKTRKARMGDKSSVPAFGIIPRNTFK